MTAIHVRDVPEPVVAALRERAARRGRSMQQEIRQILQAAAAQQVPPAPVDPLPLHTVHSGSTTTWRREEIYGDAGR
jgi:plasmid stability protein